MNLNRHKHRFTNACARRSLYFDIIAKKATYLLVNSDMKELRKIHFYHLHTFKNHFLIIFLGKLFMINGIHNSAYKTQTSS